MKKIRYKLAASLLCLSTLGLVGCGNDSVADKTQQGIVQEIDTETGSLSTKNDKTQDGFIEYVNEDGEIIHDYGAQYIIQENLCTLQDTVNMYGITYQILSWEKSKEFGDRNSENLVDYLGDRIDAENNFIGDESYVFITMKITNETEKTVEVCRCPGSVVLIDENMQVFSMGGDCIYMDKHWYGGDEKSILFYRLAPGESITCEFAQMVWDSEADVAGRKMYYWIKASEDEDDLANRYILLEE